MSRNKKFVYGGIALFIVVASWFGGYVFFVNSGEWTTVKQIIRHSEGIQSRVGDVKDISVSPWGLKYSFSSNWARAELDLNISGEKDVARFSVEIEKDRRGAWVIKRISEKR